MSDLPDPQLEFLQGLASDHATIAGDVVQLGTDTWAIHGSIPVDGDVLLAEYETRARAKQVLDQLPARDVGTVPPPTPPGVLG